MYVDIQGQKFHRLTVVKTAGKTNQNSMLWECKCDCGNTCIARGDDLRRGKRKSCGCIMSEKWSTRSHKSERIHNIWRLMHERCKNIRHKSYKYYGLKGISVCVAWSDFEVFRTWAMNNGYTDILTIDRIDPTGAYCPENCRWITMRENAQRARGVLP